LLSLVCPVYNEAENIGPLLDALSAHIRVPAELVVVYDFEEDTTLPVIRERLASFEMPIRLLRNNQGRGALGAVKTGLHACTKSTAIVVIMADLSDDLPGINTMYSLIDQGEYDLVCGSRYMPGGQQIGGPPLKGFLSRLAGLSLHFLAGIPTHDATNNFKAYRGAYIEAVNIESVAGFEIGLELVVKAHAGGYRIGEIPTVWRDRAAGTSRFDLLRWLPHYLRWYWYALRNRPPSGTHTLRRP
jgi:glycosyltransferase involved in cell wall biosynthesis